MNYQALKSMIESLINSYKCQECGSNITGDNVDIIGAAGNSVNIDIECSNCKKHAMIKSQVVQIDMNNIKGLKNNLQNLKSNIENPIKDSEMVKLSKNLKNRNLKVKDLFND